VASGRDQDTAFSQAGRIEAGYLLRLLQKGQTLRLPQSRPMPVVGPRCHELRVRDAGAVWRIMYRLDVDAVVILEVFSKKTRATPKTVIDACIRRLREYDRA
jgi:phage-related protein